MILSLLHAESRYGAINNGVWGAEAKWCALLTVPLGLEHWVNTATKVPVSHIYCNKDMAGPLLSALQAAVARGMASELRTFDGCFHIRDTRGIPGQLSAHAYAGAIDINAATNGLGSDGDISGGLASCFIDQGFVWGKTFRRKDPMHFSILGF